MTAVNNKPAAVLTIVNDWQVAVSLDGAASAVVLIPPSEIFTVTDESYDSLPEFNPTASGGWVKGTRLKQLIAQECTTKDALVPESLEIRSADGKTGFVRNTDWDADLPWACMGRLASGAIGADQPVRISYQHAKLRIDSIVRCASGVLTVRKGVSHIASPVPPVLDSGEKRIANIWIPARLTRLGEEHLFPILEESFPAELADAADLDIQIPNAMRKLRSAGMLKILAWGDSVTEGFYLPNRDAEGWQAQFVARLGKLFPKTDIQLET